MNCRDAGLWMHEYLDGIIEEPQQIELNNHLLDCPDCRTRLDQLEQTEAFIRHIPQPVIPDRLSERIMQALPKPTRRDAFKQWFKRHPASSVAVVFAIVMLSSFLSLWDKGTDLVVKGADLDGLIIQGDMVIVPEGQTVNGDLMVENGRLQVDGKIDGNVIVVDGSYNAASTALIAGQVQDIHQNIDYFWYRVKQFFSGFSR